MEYKNLLDEKLVQLSKVDNNASDELLTRYKGQVKSLARRYYLQGGELDDLISEGMIGLYKAIINFKEEKNVKFSTFAYICITRQIISAVKTDLAKKNVPLNMSLPINEAINLIGSINPEEEVIFRENQERFYNFLKANLSENEYSVITKYISGQNYKEIANDLDLTEKQVDNALSRAKNKILKYLRK